MTPIQYSQREVVVSTPNQPVSILEFSSIEHTFISIYIKYLNGDGLSNVELYGSLTKDPWFKFVSGEDVNLESPNGFLEYYNKPPNLISTAEGFSDLFIGIDCPYFIDILSGLKPRRFLAT